MSHPQDNELHYIDVDGSHSRVDPYFCRDGMYFSINGKERSGPVEKKRIKLHNGS